MSPASSKKVEVLKSTEWSFAELKQPDHITKSEFSTALHQNTVLKALPTIESEKLCKCEEMVEAEPKEKLDIEKQLANLRKEKAGIGNCVLLASRDHAKAKSCSLLPTSKRVT